MQIHDSDHVAAQVYLSPRTVLADLAEMAGRSTVEQRKDLPRRGRGRAIELVPDRGIDLAERGALDFLVDRKEPAEQIAVFALPEHHRRRMRISNPIERAVQQELKRRTIKVRVFPGEDALERLVSAILVEIDEKWASDTKAYIKWECQDA